ncbi:uncharacterized protein PAC_14320 [Phialocephala subalpina]|uniref:MYND-type domain-containing protein n=1 Tax=Phialocephala subalpina TaxID=576137 RepID=A0A1L7XHB5_9HELO|nr:uncharacterized protein PAC_14320 [Phialocephala subalpina]
MRALFIIVITILFLNTLIALLSLKIKTADKNASNLFHLQMTSLQVEIELGCFPRLNANVGIGMDISRAFPFILSRWISFQYLKTIETLNPQVQFWFLNRIYCPGYLLMRETFRFPEWFNYSMTESEKRTWDEYKEKNLLKWLDESNFNEDKEHVPYIPEATTQQAVSNNTATAASSSTARQQAAHPPPSTQSNSAEASSSQPQASAPEPEEPPLIIHDGKPATDLLAALGPVDDIEFPVDDTPEPDPYLDDLDDDIWDFGTKAKPPSSTQSTSKLRIICQQPGSLCNNCRKVAYYSKAHQREHWKTHKSECKSSQDVVAEPAVELAELSYAVYGNSGKLCTGCNTVEYCRKEHQRLVWKNHKSACKGKGKA